MEEQLKQLRQLILSLYPPGKEREEQARAMDNLEREVAAELAPLNEQVDRAIARTQSPEYREEHIKKCATQFFPKIVADAVEQQLRVRSNSDIKTALVTLYQLREKGVSAVWDKIKPSVVQTARRQLGTIFPEECIEAGRAQALDLEYLGIFLASEIKDLKDCPLPTKIKKIDTALKITGSSIENFGIFAKPSTRPIALPPAPDISGPKMS